MSNKLEGSMQAAEGASPGTRAVLQRVALLSMPRTGSTMMTRQLSTHPSISFLGAIFSVRGWKGDGGQRSKLRRGLSPEWDQVDYRIAHHRELMDRWFGLAAIGECYGLKQHLGGPDEVSATLIADSSIAKILLIRANILASYSSDRLVKAHEDAGSSASKLKIAFDAQDFEAYWARRRRVIDDWRSKLIAGTGPWMEIEYGEARTRSGIARVVDFIGLDPGGLGEQRTSKRNADNILSRFTDPDGVMRYLAANRLEGWIEEAQLPQENDQAAAAPAIEPMNPRRAERIAARRARAAAAKSGGPEGGDPFAEKRAQRLEAREHRRRRREARQGSGSRP